MNRGEVKMDLSAQEADFMSKVLKGLPDTKAKIDEMLFAWAEGVLTDEQNAWVEDLMSKDPNNVHRIGPGKVLLALSEPAAAAESAIPVSFSEDELEGAKPKIEAQLHFIDLMASRDKMHIIEDSSEDGLPEDDEEVQTELLNSASRFEAKKRIGQQVLRTINSHFQD